MALRRWRRAESGGSLHNWKETSKYRRSLIHTQQHTAFIPQLFKIFHMKTVLYDQSLSRWVQFLHLLHECQPRKKPIGCFEQNLNSVFVCPTTSHRVLEVTTCRHFGHNSCFKPLHNPLQIPQASQCASSWHAFPIPGLMECLRIFRWFSTCFVNLRRY